MCPNMFYHYYQSNHYWLKLFELMCMGLPTLWVYMFTYILTNCFKMTHFRVENSIETQTDSFKFSEFNSKSFRPLLFKDNNFFHFHSWDVKSTNAAKYHFWTKAQNFTKTYPKSHLKVWGKKLSQYLSFFAVILFEKLYLLEVTSLITT